MSNLAEGTLDSLLSRPGASGPLESRVAAVAGGLVAAGVQPGDVVAWQLPNSVAAVELFRACWRVGAVAAPLHHLAGAADVDRLLPRLSPRLVVGPDDGLPSGSPVPVGAVPASPDDVAVVLATSGSTGMPKLARHSHRGLVYKAEVMTAVHGLSGSDCILLPAPMAHISGLLNGVLLAASGMRVVPMARWDAGEALRIISRERVTFMIGPPAFFVSLVEAPGFDPSLVASLRQISCGGAGVTPAFVQQTSSLLGCRVKRTYGSTEAPTMTTSTLADPPERAAETDGRPVGSAEIRIAEGGELWVRGPELFVGYDDPAATEAAFADDGWFRTGDMGRIDDEGWLTIVGRLKDIIIRGGENIATAEVEAVLERHAAVSSAVCVGYPDHRLGERVCAFVVASTPFDLATCREWFAHEAVTRFKWPERVIQLDALPLLPTAKPDRTALRSLAAEPV